jgi:hypothetical protein
MFTHVTGAVYRHDPTQMHWVEHAGGSKTFEMKEVPFDYGTVGPVQGGIHTVDQGGAKGFQDGLGVDVRGNLAIVSNIYYVPKFEETNRWMSSHNWTAGNQNIAYEGAMRRIMERIKKGEEVYSVKRWPGRRLAGGTIWVYDRTGELRSEDLIPGMGFVNGVQLDVDGGVYVVFNCPKRVGGKSFLSGKGRIIGDPDSKPLHPFTGTLMKVSPKGAKLTSLDAQIKPDPVPNRPHDLGGLSWNDQKPDGWVDGAEWMYAGAGPIVPNSCSCPNSRFWTDWYKRTWVPEAYRHGVGILDTNGNLIMHLGRYGNADSGRGEGSPVKVGGDGITFAHVQYVTGTDGYFCASDIANERIVVVKVAYHEEAEAAIQ